MKRSLSSIGPLGLALLAGCSSALVVETEPASSPVADALELDRFVALEADGVRGGVLAVHLPASVDDVLAALLDFENAAGHRSWAASFELLESSEDEQGKRHLARWDFRGKLGVQPSVTIEFRPERHAGGASVAFELVDGALGLRTFHGSYELEPTADGRTWFAQRVFLSSGLAFVDATYEDIEAGLRDDAKRLAAWLEQRDPEGVASATTL